MTDTLFFIAKIKTVTRLTVYGFLFGACFPLGAWTFDLVNNYDFQLNAIAQAHHANPLHWIIDSAPFVLAMMGHIIGIHRQRLENHSEGLKKLNQALKKEIHERKKTEESLFEEKERAHITLESIGDGVITTSPTGDIEYLNPAAKTITGWSRDEAFGKSFDRVFAIVSDSQDPLESNFSRCLREGRAKGKGMDLSDPTMLISKQGCEIFIEKSTESIRDRLGNLVGVVVVFHDVTKAHNLAEKITYQASHDVLTGLINRRAFEERLSRVLNTSKMDKTENALAYLDLDRFKIINDSCGHIAGDEFLRQIGAVLKANIRKRDTLARLGGDEFGVLMEHCSLSHALDRANTLVDSVRNFRFTWEDNVFSVGVSIGLVGITADSTSIREVLKKSDSACYAAKDSGSNRIYIYRESDNELVRRQGE